MNNLSNAFNVLLGNLSLCRLFIAFKAKTILIVILVTQFSNMPWSSYLFTNLYWTSCCKSLLQDRRYHSQCSEKVDDFEQNLIILREVQLGYCLICFVIVINTNFFLGLTVFLCIWSLCVCEYVCVFLCECMCECVCVWNCVFVC